MCVSRARLLCATSASMRGRRHAVVTDMRHFAVSQSRPGLAKISCDLLHLDWF